MGDAEMIGGSTAFAIVMILLFCLYACDLHKCRRPDRATVTDLDAFSDTENVLPLSYDVIASLPVFVCGPMTDGDKLECAVCISEFREGEKLRLLPKCRHCFHTECIDVWFRSHSTCPLCRVVVDSASSNLQVV